MVSNVTIKLDSDYQHLMEIFALRKNNFRKQCITMIGRDVASDVQAQRRYTKLTSNACTNDFRFNALCLCFF